MRSVKTLISAANPIPEQPSPGLSGRAEEELSALLATRETHPAWGSASRPQGKTRRMRLALASVVVAAVALAATSTVWVLKREARPTPSDTSAYVPSAAEPFYRDTESLQGRADIIARATIRDTHAEKRQGILNTVATAEISAAGKGSLTRGAVVRFAYATPGTAAEAPTAFKVGGEYVLLLQERAAGEPASLVSSIQGYYTVVDGRPVPNESNPVALSADVMKELDLR